MSNIVIYSTKPMPELQATLMDIDEAEVRVVSIDKIKDYAVINPSLMIIENIDLAKDALKEDTKDGEIAKNLSQDEINKIEEGLK